MENRGALVKALGGIIAGIAVTFGTFVWMAIYLFFNNFFAAMIIGICSTLLVNFLLILNKKLFCLLPIVLLKIPFFRNILCKAVRDDAE